MTGEELFWDLAEALYSDPGVSRSTMMGLPCLRYQGRFFALPGPQDAGAAGQTAPTAGRGAHRRRPR